MSDTRAIPQADLYKKITEFRERVDDNRRTLELLASSGALSRTKEGRWLRDVLSERATVIKLLLDGLHRVRDLYASGQTTEALREQRKLAGLLFVDSSGT